MKEGISGPTRAIGRYRPSLLLSFISLLLIAIAPPHVVASGLETSGIGARGRSMGYSLAAVADDWSSLYYNPAGLARIARTSSDLRISPVDI